MTKTLTFLEKQFLQLWWVIFFVLFCCMLLEQGLKKRDHDYQSLSEQLNYLQEEERIAIHTQNNLLLQINSESDPAWIELTLMKSLGLVPENQTKIFFKKI